MRSEQKLPRWVPAVAVFLLATTAAAIPTMTFFEGFEDDFAANRNVPDLAVPSLSSTFVSLNGPALPGTLAIRDRALDGPVPFTALDFSNGGGGMLTLAFTTPFDAAAGSTIDFDVVIFGGDRNSLFKYVSNDGVTFTQVGDTDDSPRHYQFDLLPGGRTTYFRLIENGNGLWVDNFGASIIGVPEPTWGLWSAWWLSLTLASNRRQRQLRESFTC